MNMFHVCIYVWLIYMVIVQKNVKKNMQNYNFIITKFSSTCQYCAFLWWVQYSNSALK